MQALNLAGIVYESIVDGPGLRTVFFAQGCKHNCVSCFNPELQPFVPVLSMTLDEILSEMKKRPHIRGVTFSGGDPFEQADAFAALALFLSAQELSIWCYTGYLFEELVQNETRRVLLERVHVLVDGPFLLSEKDGSLAFRGSKNQRIICVPSSLREGKVVLY